ncbi:WNK lysine deficient protein kinase [Monoraphidium neglectum]|uniref:non-specific serine/threonine protein kinase n=1 Tax=Monoraphidium neglectum TaxID=145388 RepID=A0A0D2N699_9CHLO|nr:WNK lysine deficient protein kinase [Monoraphidium neglectum]KIZ07807.1 WNK lysine deficient protein kinase [Monoraphidium neglectum]|eukprot:XP_013906826.1 WNK lysine deficient protein kinase [Monoraphidium neglectum]
MLHSFGQVDVYSFGMCMLELATLEYPYSECRSIPAIFRKVSQGIPPAGLGRVQSGELRSFIQICIQFDPTQRPGALALLKHPFFDSLRADASACSTPTLAWSIMARSFSPVVSCSNLSALAHGSHARGSCSDAFGAGGAAGSGASTPKAGGHRISLFSEQAAHYPGCEGARRIADGVGGEQVKEGADAHEVERQGSQGREGHPNLRQASEQQRRSVAHAVAVAEAAAQRLMATGEGAGGGEASGKRRGMTVCVAAIINAHAGGEEDEDDEDEEVICALADVLQHDDGDEVASGSGCEDDCHISGHLCGDEALGRAGSGALGAGGGKWTFARGLQSTLTFAKRSTTC